MKLIKIDDSTYINPEKIIAISLPPNPEYAQYWLTIALESKVKVSLQFTCRLKLVMYLNGMADC